MDLAARVAGTNLPKPELNLPLGFGVMPHRPHPYPNVTSFPRTMPTNDFRLDLVSQIMGAAKLDVNGAACLPPFTSSSREPTLNSSWTTPGISPSSRSVVLVTDNKFGLFV